MKKFTLMIAIVVIVVIVAIVTITTIASCGTHGFTTSNNPYDREKRTQISSWSNSFEYNSINDAIKNKKISGVYAKLFPIPSYWTYGTLQPSGAAAILATYTDKNETYVTCTVPPAVAGTTSKSQIARKFPPYGIDEAYNELTAFFPGDTVTVRFDMCIGKGSSSEERVYFCDFEDSTTENAGIRFYFRGDSEIGVNRDKIMSKDTYISTRTDIPIDSWFNFMCEIKIGKNDGNYKMWINDRIILDERGLSIVDELKFYDSVMIGITGTLSKTKFSLSVDNFKIDVQRMQDL
jgi:hypothetical protein